MDHVRHHSRLIHAPLDQGNARVQPQQVRRMSNPHFPHYLGRRIVLNKERHALHEVFHLLRQLADDELNMFVKGLTNLGAYFSRLISHYGKIQSVPPPLALATPQRPEYPTIRPRWANRLHWRPNAAGRPRSAQPRTRVICYW